MLKQVLEFFLSFQNDLVQNWGQFGMAEVTWINFPFVMKRIKAI